ncbi:SAM-dependent methyltransferase [Actinomadura roseirufa]|uniref:SAM-dependent methyltransferase n=1 Tax=Actinomadura roseirufa TaxID=2094049 RepID=UPI0013F1722C|nr:SAM-dependent methyltransferase [Actinomadura roseirufa]
MKGGDGAEASLFDGRPCAGRVHDYLLGGRDNCAVDREAGDQLLRVVPEARAIALENRAFLRRAVHYLSGERGVAQFLDVGSGLPTRCSTHHAAQTMIPWARTVYIDHDPLVVSHARTLVRDGRTQVARADMHHVAEVIDAARGLLDFDQPVAVMLVAVLDLTRDARRIVRELVKELAFGSFVVVTHGEAGGSDVAPVCREGLEVGVPRSRKEIAGLMTGLQLAPPGLVAAAAWKNGLVTGEAAGLPLLGAVGRVCS